MKRLLLSLIRAYQLIFSPWVGHNCRYLPTCSQYSFEAIQKFGAIKGGWMMIARLARCHPFGGSGLDEVPATFRWRCWCKDCAQDKSAQIFNQITIEQNNHGK